MSSFDNNPKMDPFQIDPLQTWSRYTCDLCVDRLLLSEILHAGSLIDIWPNVKYLDATPLARAARLCSYVWSGKSSRDIARLRLEFFIISRAGLPPIDAFSQIINLCVGHADYRELFDGIWICATALGGK